MAKYILGQTVTLTEISQVAAETSRLSQCTMKILFQLLKLVAEDDDQYQDRCKGKQGAGKNEQVRQVATDSDHGDQVVWHVDVGYKLFSTLAKRLAGKNFCEMAYFVSSGTRNLKLFNQS